MLDGLVEESIREEYPGKKEEHYIWLNQLFAALPQPFDMATTMPTCSASRSPACSIPTASGSSSRPTFRWSPPGQITLSHEICHGFQDQNFSLLKMGIEDPGTATGPWPSIPSPGRRHAARWANISPNTGETHRYFRLPAQHHDHGPAEAGIRASRGAGRAALSPISRGCAFFQTLHGRVRRDPQLRLFVADSSWRNEVFKDPPISTQQILHPDLYLANKKPASIETPALDQAGPATNNVAGEFGVTQLLEPLLGTERAETAAAGWNGDRIAVADSQRRQAPPGSLDDALGYPPGRRRVRHGA